MKIKEIRLKNFARVYAGLGKTSITIPFDSMPYAISLFVGDNGSGKTSLLRSLHPFAYNSSAGDNTDNADLIIEGKDGEKNISILHNGHQYDITHIYSRKKDETLSIKSFIQEDGVELNDSGTVKTFKDVVLDKLGLDESFLSLISLGNTIDGFVKYTAANRKKAVTQIFSQLNIYNKHYKTVSAKVRDTKSVLSNITMKLERYKGYNVDELELHKLELESNIERLKNDLDSVIINIGGVMQIITDNEEFIQSHDEKRDRFNELLLEMNSIRSKISTKKDLVVLKNELSKINDNINTLKITISGIETSLASELDIKDTKVATIKTLKDTAEKMSKNTDIRELTELKAALDKELAELSTKTSIERPVWSKEDLVKINIYLDELRGMCIDIISEVNNHKIIPDVLKDYLNDNDVITKIDRAYDELKYDMNRSKSMLLSKNILDGLRIRKLPESCKTSDSCVYVKFYHDVVSVLTSAEEDTEKQIQTKQNALSETEDMLKAATIISKLYNFIHQNERYFDLPKELFDRDTFILQYMKDRTIYDAEILSRTIELVEAFERKDIILQKIEDTNDKINSITNTSSMYLELKEQIRQLEISIEDIETMMEQQRKDLSYNNEQLKQLEGVAEDVEKQITLLTNLDNVKSEFASVKSDLSTMENRMQKITDAQEKYTEYQANQASIKRQISEVEDQLKSTQLIISTIQDLKHEQRELMEKYSWDNLILESVSPTKGIPLEFINYYIKEQMIGKVNELLELVYHGKLKLSKSKTVINEDEFTIPYIKRGTVVKDISKASDGEKAIISLAFSLVLLNITAGPYNILLLDEMDTTLDVKSRAKYIELLEQFMKIIHAEQLFLISHNSMFDVYPVNVLLTSNSVVNMPNAHVINLAS